MGSPPSSSQGGEKKMRKVMMMVALVALLVALFATAAFAKTFQCTSLNCDGTRNPDTISERVGNVNPDNIFGGLGGDVIDARDFFRDEDKLYGNKGSDRLDARDADNLDTVNGGQGVDECFGDADDLFIKCEYINGDEQ